MKRKLFGIALNRGTKNEKKRAFQSVLKTDSFFIGSLFLYSFGFATLLPDHF